jgi:hypothetical protein
MEQEHRILTDLAEQRWILVRQIQEVDAAIAKNSHYFYVGEDGLLDVNVMECL